VAGVVSAMRWTAGRSMPSTNVFQRSCRWSGALYFAIRVMSSDAFTRALSALYGIEPCPGVPFTRRRVHCEPFSAVMIGSFAPLPIGNRAPPNSVTR
jgi:hypothetical protein